MQKARLCNRRLKIVSEQPVDAEGSVDPEGSVVTEYSVVGSRQILQVSTEGTGEEKDQ